MVYVLKKYVEWFMFNGWYGGEWLVMINSGYKLTMKNLV